MTVVVTGAAGHVGANLVRALVAAGRPVRAVVFHDARGLAGLPVAEVQADVGDLASLLAAFDGAEVVYHLAARISITGAQRGLVRAVNVGGTANVVAACLERRVRRLVHFSSIHALCQEPRGEPLDEERPFADTRRCLAYDRAKAEAEREVLAGVARGLDAVIVSPTAVLGPHDHKLSPMGEVLLRLARGRFPALVPGGFDWVDVRDVVAGALAAERQGRTGERYLLAGAWLSVPDLAALCAELTGVHAPGFVAPMWLARLGAPFVTTYSRARGRRPLYTRDSLAVLRRSNPQIRSDKAARELGYRARPLRETVGDTLRWLDEAFPR